MGSVKKVMHRTSGNVYALKAVDKKQVKDHNLEHQLLAEVETQKKLSHPNLLRCFDYFTEANTVYILLELASGGDLYQHMRRRGHLNEPQVAYLFRQVCEGVRHLHENGIIHRDLKPENILLTEDMTVKIADFGWAAKADKTDTRKTFCGTLCMLAPEMIAGKEYDARIDVWAVGVLLFEMLTGCTPFDKGQGLMETCKAIVGPGLSAVPLDDVPPAAHPLLRGLMQQEATMRMSLDECLQSDWVMEQCAVYTEESNATARGKAACKKALCAIQRPSNTIQMEVPQESVAPQLPQTSRVLAKELQTGSVGSTGYKRSFSTSTETPSSTAAPSANEAEISPVSPVVFPQPRGSSASRGAETVASASSNIGVKAVEEDTPWERESVSSVASMRSEGKWRLQENKELLPKVELETPRAVQRSPLVDGSANVDAKMPQYGTRLNLLQPPRTQLGPPSVLDETSGSVSGASNLEAAGFLRDVACSDSSSDEMPEGETAFGAVGAVFGSSALSTQKRWSQERLKSLDDGPVSPVQHSHRPSKLHHQTARRQEVGGGYPVPRVFRPDHSGPAAKAVARSSMGSSHSSSDGHSNRGSSAGQSSTSRSQASNKLVSSLTGLGYSLHKAIEAARRTSSVEAAVEWLEDRRQT